MRRTRLTPEVVDTTPAPDTGEIRLADTETRGLGLRVWAGPSGGGRAFDFRGKDAQGRWTRRTYDPWSRDAVRPQWVRYGRLGDCLEDARRWAEVTRLHLRGAQTPAEQAEDARQKAQQSARARPFEAQVTAMLEAGAAEGWSIAYRDSIDTLAAALPEDIRRAPMDEIDPAHFVRALANLPFTVHRIDTLRAFVSKMGRSKVTGYAGRQLEAQRTTALYRQAIAEDWSPDFRARLSAYEPFVAPVLAALRSDPAWVPAMALSMYLRTGAKQAPLLQARWSMVLDGFWYPYPPGSRSSWFLARERLADDLLAELERHHARVRDAFGETEWMFPRLDVRGQPVPITSLWRCFQRALKAAGWTGGKVRLREFAMVAQKLSASSCPYGVAEKM